MYLTQSNVIRGLAKQDYTMLREMCQYSNNLYNVAVYTIRQHYFDTQQFLRYEENSPICKKNENYGLLQAGVAQQILKMANRSFRSFFGLLQKVKSGDYGSKAVRLPHYREKGGLFSLILSTNAITIKNGLVETVSYVERRTMFFFKSSTEIFASVFSTSAIILYSLAPLPPASGRRCSAPCWSSTR